MVEQNVLQLESKRKSRILVIHYYYYCLNDYFNYSYELCSEYGNRIAWFYCHEKTHFYTRDSSFI